MSLCPIFRWGDPGLDRWLDRSPVFDLSVVTTVSAIVEDVRQRGTDAVLDQVRQFDARNAYDLFADPSDFDDSLVELEIREAIDTAIERVTSFHQIQLDVVTSDWDQVGNTWGWRMDVTENDDHGFEGQRMLPLRSAGIYVPGGRANYPSSVIMNVVPALVAGVGRIVIATPPQADGTIHPVILYTAKALGVKSILMAGGASAVAALALGLPGFPRVDVITGPGNVYVNEAKRQLWGSVGLDMYAGPSEVAVVVDGTVDPRFSAVDLMTQVEHAPDNVGLLVGYELGHVQAVLDACETILQTQPRAEIIRQALNEQSVAVVAGDLMTSAEVVNRFAPEHASLHVADFGPLAEHITNCGCLMIGPETAQSAGDYCGGPSHTLPTGGAARFASAVSVTTFLKTQSVSMYSKSDIEELAPVISTLAAMEGFPTHAYGATLRTEIE